MPQKTKKRLKIAHPNKLIQKRSLIFMLLFAAVGGFLVFRSFAATTDDLVAKGFSTYNSSLAKTIKISPNQKGGYFMDGFGGIQPFQLGNNAPPPLPKGTSVWSNGGIARDFVITNWTIPAGYTMDLYGGMHPFGGAGAANGAPYWSGRDIARKVALTRSKTSGFTLDAYGGLHGFGVGARPAPTQLKTTAYWSGQDIARGLVISPSSDKGYVLDAYCGLHPFSFNGAALPPAVTSNTGYITKDVCKNVIVTNWSKPAGYVVRRDGGMYPFGGASAGAGYANFKPAEGIADITNVDSNEAWVLGQKGTVFSFATANQPLKATSTVAPKNAERMGFNFGGNAFMQIPKNEYFNYIALSGIKWSLFEVTQGSVTPAKNTYNFSSLDGIMAEARRVNTKVVMGLNASAKWDNPTGKKPTNLDAWADFAGKTAARYKDVKAFAIWNEPNISNYWGTPVTPGTYTSLLCKSYAKIKAANPAATVIALNSAPAGDLANQDTMAPATYLRKIYESGGRDCFDAIGHHPYQWDAGLVGDYGFNATNHLREVMVANGDAGKKIWATEVGYPTQLLRQPSKSISETEQAFDVPLFMNAWWYQNWGAQGFTGPWFQYKLFESGTSGDEPGFGLIKTNAARTQNPAFKAYVDYGQKRQ